MPHNTDVSAQEEGALAGEGGVGFGGSRRRVATRGDIKVIVEWVCGRWRPKRIAYIGARLQRRRTGLQAYSITTRPR